MRNHQHTFVFIGGLHRSGTSLLARCIAEHPAVSVFRNTGVPEDEGQHLQDVYLPAKAHGGPGRFGFDPQAHLTEVSLLATPANAQRLLDQWSRYWDMTRPIVLEKSPPNLIRSRFLQALFPDARFIMVMRHPIPVSLATERWCKAPEARLLEHWVLCHQLWEEDAPHLKMARLVRYEDFVAEPQSSINNLWSWLGLPSVALATEIRSDVNAEYFKKWRERHRGVRGWLQRAALRRRFEKCIARWDYSFEQT